MVFFFAWPQANKNKTRKGEQLLCPHKQHNPRRLHFICVIFFP